MLIDILLAWVVGIPALVLLVAFGAARWRERAARRPVADVATIYLSSLLEAGALKRPPAIKLDTNEPQFAAVVTSSWRPLYP